MGFKDKLIANPVIRLIYHGKWYFEYGSAQVSFFTSKLPELMAAIYLLEKFGIYSIEKWTLIAVISVFSGVLLFGFVLKKIGMYDTQAYVCASIDPVQKEILESARIIKKNDRKS